MAPLHKMLEALKDENKTLNEMVEDQELIISATKLENEMMKRRLAKLGDMTIKQELRARILCAVMASNKTHISNEYADSLVEYILKTDDEGDENADPS